MDTLEPPYQFFHPQLDRPFDLPVVRYEVGIAQRPIADPPYSVIKLTIRFHLALPLSPDLWLAVRAERNDLTDRLTREELAARPYLDFTNKILMNRVLATYDDLIARPPNGDLEGVRKRLEATSPQNPRPLTLRLTRHGLRTDTVYDVEVVWP